MIEVDTNILLRHANVNDVQHIITRTKVDSLIQNGNELCLFPQNIYEFWVAATRPASVNGLGLTIPQVENLIIGFRNVMTFLPDQPTLYPTWQSLVVTHQCLGKPAHDARLVAAMQTYGITELLTFNVKDFQRYPGLLLHDPQQP